MIFNFFMISLRFHWKQFVREPKLAALSILLRAMNALGPLLVWQSFFYISPRQIGGQSEHIFIIMGLACSTLGFNNCLFDGLFELPQIIRQNRLAPYFLMPSPPELNVLFSSQNWSGLGYVISGFSFFAMANLSLLQAISTLIVLLPLQLFYIGFFLSVNSISFIARSTHRIAIYLDSMITAFTQFPESLFGPTMKFIFYSVVPAGILSYWPARAIENMDILSMMILTILSILVFALGVVCFRKGFEFYARSV